MALLTTATDKNKIIDQPPVERVDWMTYAGAKWERTITEERYRYVGMTYASAVSAAADIHAPLSGIIAIPRRGGANGSYYIEVNATTFGEWGVVA